MLGGGCCSINSCGVDAFVAEDVGKLSDILFHSVKGSCEKVAQVMRIDLGGRNVCVTAELLHIAPYVVAAELFSAFCDENRA